MSTILAFARRRPVSSYFALAFAISWGGILLLAAIVGAGVLRGAGTAPAAGGQLAWPFAIALLLWFAGPSLSSVLMTGVVDGRSGLRALGRRLRRWRVDARWYAVAILTAPLLVAAVQLALALRSPAFLPGVLTTPHPIALVLFGIGWGLLGGGFLEELGWTGFAVPRLRRRHSALATALLVGACWGALHFILVLWGSASMAGAHALAVYVLAILCFYGGVLTAYRVLMVWVHDRTTSLPLAMLMHASLSASMLILQAPVRGVDFLAANAALAAVLWTGIGLAALWRVGRRAGAPLDAPTVALRDGEREDRAPAS